MKSNWITVDNCETIDRNTRPFYNVGLAVVNDQLYAVGGFDGTTYLKTVEVYDRETNQWRQSGCMTYRRLGGGVGVVRLDHDQYVPFNSDPDLAPFDDPPLM
ncbi:unnamed protein product [Onchocerca flexuosa]|uniref:Kelch repeat protein n=1 Tax=Onchocerca flexuosa TaxID=387005 RepID=A0A183HAJ7_9BILA|nr:unnamed protein product [Onchocerca flexuosa]